MDSGDPRQALAERLRNLREEHWPGGKITQPQLARALGGVSVSLISSWESRTDPKVPPPERLEAYAALFATPNSLAGRELRLISPRDMSDEERQAMNDLKRELLHMRGAAMAAAHPAAALPASNPVASAQLGQVAESLSTGPWRFEDGDAITLVCAQWPQAMMKDIPYTDIDDPDYIELLTYSELDSLFELHGYLRAANPASEINRRIAHRLKGDDYTSHLVSLGGVDWNQTTTSLLNELQLPVAQIADWEKPDGAFFEVEENGRKRQYAPTLGKNKGREVLRQDVALFARAVNPWNSERTVTICNGMYGRGTYGAVRALTDPRFRDRNAEYLETRFAGSRSYFILTRVSIVNGETVTPDWTREDYRLFEWSGEPDAV